MRELASHSGGITPVASTTIIARAEKDSEGVATKRVKEAPERPLVECSYKRCVE